MMIPIATTPGDNERVSVISAAIPGWSDIKQYAFFKALLAEATPSIREVLILGVYHGRDMAFLLDVANRYCPHRELRVVGVDKFNAEPCEDWPEGKRGMTWEQAGFGLPPDFERAKKNLAPFQGISRAAIVIKQDDFSFLAETKLMFDAVYIDTSHDYASAKRVIDAVPNVCREHTIIGGDDYSDEGTWGVKRAVSESFETHGVFAGWIWYSNRQQLKGVIA